MIHTKVSESFLSTFSKLRKISRRSGDFLQILMRAFLKKVNISFDIVSIIRTLAQQLSKYG